MHDRAVSCQLDHWMTGATQNCTKRNTALLGVVEQRIETVSHVAWLASGPSSTHSLGSGVGCSPVSWSHGKWCLRRVRTHLMHAGRMNVTDAVLHLPA